MIMVAFRDARCMTTLVKYGHDLVKILARLLCKLNPANFAMIQENVCMIVHDHASNVKFHEESSKYGALKSQGST